MVAEREAEERVKAALRAALLEEGLTHGQAARLSDDAWLEVDDKRDTATLRVAHRSFEAPLPVTGRFYDQAVHELAINLSMDGPEGL